MAVFIIMLETMGLAGLISEEVEGRTIQALLVTPMNVTGLFLAKGTVGVTLAFGQAMLFMAIVGGFSQQPLVVMVALLLGAILATGIGFLMASLSKSLMSVFAYGMVALIVLIIPAFGILFPGTVSGWAQAIPSYYLVDTVHLAANFGFGWVEVWDNLLILLGFDVAIFGLGIWALRRKMR
jgi:ABC-type multidrug transport system permease subunit